MNHSSVGATKVAALLWHSERVQISTEDRVADDADNRARRSVVGDDHRRRRADLHPLTQLNVALDVGGNRRVVCERVDTFSLFRRQDAVDDFIDIPGLAPFFLLAEQNIRDVRRTCRADRPRPRARPRVLRAYAAEEGSRDEQAAACPCLAYSSLTRFSVCSWSALHAGHS